MIRRCACCLLLFMLAFLPAGPTWAGPARLADPVQAIGQVRAFWVDAWNGGIKTPAQVDQLIADAHAANVNTLFVQVRRRGDSYYNESVEPRAADGALDPPPFDPLAYLIGAAHGANPPLQVHAWVVAFPVWSPGYSTGDPEHHVYYQHGCGDGCSWDDPDNWLTYRYEGGSPQPDYQIDPGHPAAARYTLDVCLYLIRHYDVDGLHLDYIRYNGDQYGYNKTNVDRFHAAHGGSGLPDPADENWKDWRREQVTAVVRRIYLEALAVKPDLVVSAATIAWGDGPGSWEHTSAYKSVFQDWRAWLEEGIVDLAVPMNYDREHEEDQQAYFEHWIEWEKDHQYGRGLVVGQGAWLNYIPGTLAQAHQALAPSQAGREALGVTFYSYAHTNKDDLRPNPEFYQALSQAGAYGSPPFPTWVDPPALPWKENPFAGHLAGWAIGPAGPLDGAEIQLYGPQNRSLRSDGGGFFGAADLPPGAYTVLLPAPAVSPLYATVEAGRVALATVAPEPTEPALRALLVDAAHDGFKTPDQVDVLLADARAAHLNALIVQVRVDGQRYYESDIEPRAADPELAAGFDPLGYLLQQARAADPPLEVYAWLTLLPVWQGDLAQVPPGHVLAQHPDWLNQDAGGSQLAAEGYYLDPGHPAVLTYTVDLVLDLVQRYPLDGLFFDGLRYPADGAAVGYPTWGYNPTAVQRFRARCGGSGAPLPDEPLWMDWRREQLEALLRQLYLRCTALRPRLRLAVSGVAWGASPDQAGGWEQSSAYGRVLQDWRGWLQQGILDLAAPEHYDREYDADQRAWYDAWLAWDAAQLGNRGLLVQQGTFLNYTEHTLEQAGEAPGGQVAFSGYIPANLYADPEGNSRWMTPPRQPWSYTPAAEWWLWRSLALPYGYTDPAVGLFTPTMPIFAGPTLTPTLDWKDAPTLGHLAGWALGPGGAPLDGVTVTLGSGAGRRLYSDGSGFFGTTDLPPGGYLARLVGAAPPYDCQYGLLQAGEVAWLAPCRPLEGLQLGGPGRLSQGWAGLYSASYAPLTATPPITVSWAASGGTVSGAGLSAALVCPSTGRYTLTVTAANPRGALSRTMAVSVFCQPPLSLTIAGPPSLLVGQAGLYRALPQPLTSSLPLAVGWDNSAVGSSAVYSWSAPGVFSITVAAANDCGSISGRAWVNVLNEWPVQAYLPLLLQSWTDGEPGGLGVLRPAFGPSRREFP